MATKKPASKKDAAVMAEEPQPGGEPRRAPTAAERSEAAALREELESERLAHLAERAQLERRVTSLEMTVEELRGELARATAQSRELEAQLRQSRSGR